MEDPHELVIAADASLTPVDYCDDQIWEAMLDRGDPPALAIQTSYGMRAVSVRFFPVFSMDEVQVIDPKEFYQPPRLSQFFPNYLSFEGQPFENIVVGMEYWVAHSKCLAGRIRIKNDGNEYRNLHFDWIGQLIPLAGGEVFHPEIINLNTVISGKTSNLNPVCFISGGPRPSDSVYPGLAMDLKLSAGRIHILTWAVAAYSSREESFLAARNQTFRNWDAEISRVERWNHARHVDIYTGNLDWDAALAFSQKAANTLIISGDCDLPNPSFVLSRQPDNGFSPGGDGKDHLYAWAGQSLFDAYYLCRILLAINPLLIKGILENALTAQEKSGDVDWRPGMAGQRTNQLAQPLLAAMVLNLMKVSLDTAWLSGVHARLIDFLLAWQRPEQDKDRDGYPEWHSAWQAGIEDWHAKTSEFSDHYFLETPSLAAMLLNESHSLIQLADLDDDHRFDHWLEDLVDKLNKMIVDGWNKREKIWSARDYRTHLSLESRRLARLNGSGLFQVQKKIEPAQRVVVNIKLKGSLPQALAVVIIGRSGGKRHRLELNVRHFHWYSGKGTFTSEELFSKIDTVRIYALQSGDQLQISTFASATEDISMLLPFWAGINGQDNHVEEIMSTLESKYSSPHGLLIFPEKMRERSTPSTNRISLPWTSFILEGMLREGKRQEAAGILIKIINATTDHLKRFGEFRAYLNAVDGKAMGERGSLHGLIPIGQYLAIAGIETLSADKIILNGFNAFDTPITVKYQGTTIMLNSDKSVVLLKSGEVIEHAQPDRVCIDLKAGRKGVGDESKR